MVWEYGEQTFLAAYQLETDVRIFRRCIVMVEKMKKKDDFVADFWKRMGYVLGIGSAFVPGMVVGMELVMKDMEKSNKELRMKD